jgi:hypothetical protein
MISEYDKNSVKILILERYIEKSCAIPQSTPLFVSCSYWVASTLPNQEQAPQ